MFESNNGRKMFHGRIMQHGCHTVVAILLFTHFAKYTMLKRRRIFSM